MEMAKEFEDLRLSEGNMKLKALYREAKHSDADVDPLGRSVIKLVRIQIDIADWIGEVLALTTAKLPEWERFENKWNLLSKKDVCEEDIEEMKHHAIKLNHMAKQMKVLAKTFECVFNTIRVLGEFGKGGLTVAASMAQLASIEGRLEDAENMV